MQTTDSNHHRSTSSATAARLILLGASNLTRGLPTIIHTARGAMQLPLDIRAALGHGRSYGKPSRVLVRTISGILDSDIWGALDDAPPASRTVALISDIGNDILYGATTETILSWVRIVLDRLEEHGAHTTMTSLPIESITRAPRWQAQCARWITYLGKGPAVDEAIARVTEIDGALRELAGQRNLAFIEQQAHWYGFDPIHITGRQWPTAARTMLAPLIGSKLNDEPTRQNLRDRLRIRTARPKTMCLFGMTIRRRQPVRHFADGSTLSLY